MGESQWTKSTGNYASEDKNYLRSDRECLGVSERRRQRSRQETNAGQTRGVDLAAASGPAPYSLDHCVFGSRKSEIARAQVGRMAGEGDRHENAGREAGASQALRNCH